MDSIFVVTQCVYDYDGGSSVPIFATSSNKRANEKVAEMQARMDVRLAMYNTVSQYMKIWEESNPRPRDNTFSKWAEDRYTVMKTFMGTFSTQEQEDYYLDDSTFWEIEIVPFEE